MALLLLLSGIVGAGMASAAESDTACGVLTDADKAANAAMSFDEFDQKGITPSTWRQLSNRQCDALAIEAAENYLVHAQSLSAGARRDVMFHLAQSLGMAGDYKSAAFLVAGAKDAVPPANADLDWSTYLDGTWAFFRRDRPALAAARDKPAVATGHGNQLNGAALTGLMTCFDKPYWIAYDKGCRSK